jgi:anti-anti-sigma factor
LWTVYYRVSLRSKHALSKNSSAGIDRPWAITPTMARSVCPRRSPGGSPVADMGNYDSLTVENVPGGAIVVHGDIDVAGGPILEAALLRREGDDVIVIDLGDVYFIDSSGLRSLLGASRRARARGATIVLKRVGPEVLRLLEITGTTGNFSIETNRD